MITTTKRPVLMPLPLRSKKILVCIYVLVYMCFNILKIKVLSEVK